MRTWLLLTLFTLAACGGPQPAVEQAETGSAEDAGSGAGPAIDPTAAPGVAFNYRHAFRLEAPRIAAVQETHAQACEKLGVARCRITGMRYRLVGEADVEAMLALKLDPSIARAFGKQAIEVVERADGMLVDSEISGVDAGAAIAAADRTRAEAEDELRRITDQLARPGLGAAERDRLRAEEQQLRQAIRASGEERRAQQATLATTPVVLEYGSGRLVPGFRSPFRDALSQAGDNLASSFAFLLLAAVTLAPWLLALIAALWIYRRWLRDKVPSQRERMEEVDPGAS